MKLDPNVAISESGVLFNPATGDSFACNSVGTEILRRLKEGEARDKIQARLVEGYGLSAESAEKDLEDFLLQLQNSNLVSGHA